jgi:hypothetical protein
MAYRPDDLPFALTPPSRAIGWAWSVQAWVEWCKQVYGASGQGFFDRIYYAVLGGPLAGFVSSCLVHCFCLLYVLKGDPFSQGGDPSLNEYTTPR